MWEKCKYVQDGGPLKEYQTVQAVAGADESQHRPDMASSRSRSPRQSRSPMHERYLRRRPLSRERRSSPSTEQKEKVFKKHQESEILYDTSQYVGQHLTQLL